jgi:hypothetical protein
MSCLVFQISSLLQSVLYSSQFIFDQIMQWKFQSTLQNFLKCFHVRMGLGDFDVRAVLEGSQSSLIDATNFL